MKFSGFPEGICFFHSASRGKHSYLTTMDTRVCSDGLVYVRLTGPYESLGESQRSFCWLRSSLLFHGEPLVNPTDVSFFFSDPQFLLLDFQTRIIPLDERGIEHFLPLFDPPSDFSLHVWHPLYASSVCGAHENRKGNVFVDFEQRRLFTRAN